MKKNLFGWLAMAAMLVGTGCSTDEVVNDYSPENAIQFGTYVGRDAQGRGSIINDAALQAAGKGFGVFAYYTGQDPYNYNSSTPNFMWNTQIHMSDGAWTYSPKKYWPNTKEDKISFFAYAPYTVAASTDVTTTGQYVNVKTLPNKTGAPVIEFKVDGTVKTQQDLLWAVDATDGLPHTDVKHESPSKAVAFKFMHALSRIGFNVEAMFDNKNQEDTGEEDGNETGNGVKPDATTIKVKSVKLIGKFYESGQLNLMNEVANKANWINTSLVLPSNEVTFELTSVNGNFTAAANDVTAGKQTLNAEDSYIMIIPQNLTGTGEGIRIVVEYDVITADDNLNGASVTVPNTVDSGYFTFNFEDGKAYSFNLHIGLTSVKFTANVTDWASGSEYVVNVPLVD